jgi:signal transduction histidine kinase
VNRAQRWRQAFDRIGGPDAVTWPAFWLTFVGSLTGNLTTGGSVSASFGTRVGVIAVTQIAMFVPLVLLRLTLLRNPTRPRPWIAIGGFILACVVRGIVLSGLLVAIGAVTEPLYLYRIAASLAGTGMIFILTALVVSAMRAHTRSLKQLIAVQQDLTNTQERIVAEVAERNEEVLNRVKERLAEELSTLDEMSDTASITELQRLASDVVRPMSHELASSLPRWETTATDIDDVHVTWQQAVGQMAKTSALRPVQSALLICMLLFVSAVGIYGLAGLVLMGVVGFALFVLSWLVNRALALVLPRLSAGPGVAVLVLASLTVGFLSAAAGAWVLRDSVAFLTFVIAGGTYLAGLAFFVAMVNAVLQQQRVLETSLSVYTEQLRREVVRQRQAQWLQRKALSRALHGPIQSAVTSAALRLDAAVRDGHPTDGLIADIREQLRSRVDVLEDDEYTSVSMDVALQRIVGTWEGVCDIDVHMTQAAIDGLEADSLAMSTVIDILTEGVSNAVRHADATQVHIVLGRDQNGDITMRISDNGISDEHPVTTSGLGTLLLNECTLSWSRDFEGNGKVLRAKIPARRPEIVGETFK